ncbi:hypothetical protein CCACVL1_23781 [Corchorus capsularis]|uniref:Ty3 transposon capsid-like protein domain-containing protein n=1 Tax=Corchorus capsularis TaxID=210143 RepID=A0A1R3GSE5_COCAP|nr:hypothetical protein CCACVL1_23781 [Corchorus capsularis]
MSKLAEGSDGKGGDQDMLGRISALESKLESMMDLLKQSIQVRDVIEPAKTEPVAQPVAEQRVVESFKMEVRIEIPIYDGELDPEKLNRWIKQLEVYFSTKPYTNQQKISFARLRLGNHAVTWWESFNSGLEAEGMAPIQTWQEFTASIKNQL